MGSSCGCEQQGIHLDFMQMISGDRRRLERSLLRSAAFTGSMAAVDNAESAGLVFSTFAREWGIHDFYAVVNPGFLRSDDNHIHGYADRMMLLCGLHNGSVQTGDTLNRHMLVPGLAKRSEPTVLAFMPLYYQDRTIGYLSLDLDYAASLAFLSLATMIDCSLMELAQRITIRKYVETLEQMSRRDVLTGLYNRRGFFLKAGELLEKARRRGRMLALLSSDMDGMKDINDNMGHLAGDEALRRMGRCISALEKEGAVCSHLSGDEFMAMAIVNSSEEAEALITHLQSAIDRLNREDPWLCDIRASAGVFAAKPT